MDKNSKLPDWQDPTSPVLKVDGGLPLFSNICNYCENLISSKERICVAFLGGIPDEIWRGENDHTAPYEGDHGILFSFVGKNKK